DDQADRGGDRGGHDVRVARDPAPLRHVELIAGADRELGQSSALAEPGRDRAAVADELDLVGVADRGGAAGQGDDVGYHHGRIDRVEAGPGHGAEHVDPAQQHDVNGRVAQVNGVGLDEVTLQRVGRDVRDGPGADEREDDDALLVDRVVAREVGLAPDPQAHDVAWPQDLIRGEIAVGGRGRVLRGDGIGAGQEDGYGQDPTQSRHRRLFAFLGITRTWLVPGPRSTVRQDEN